MNDGRGFVGAGGRVALPTLLVQAVLVTIMAAGAAPLAWEHHAGVQPCTPLRRAP